MNVEDLKSKVFYYNLSVLLYLQVSMVFTEVSVRCVAKDEAFPGLTDGRLVNSWFVPDF